jgi:hypothetical protein
VRLDQLEELGEERAVLGLGTATSFMPPFPLIGSELDQMRVGRTDNVAARLANSGLTPSVYCATGPQGPVGLFELSADKRASFLRGFV